MAGHVLLTFRSTKFRKTSSGRRRMSQSGERRDVHRRCHHRVRSLDCTRFLASLIRLASDETSPEPALPPFPLDTSTAHGHRDRLRPTAAMASPTRGSRLGSYEGEGRGASQPVLLFFHPTMKSLATRIATQCNASSSSGVEDVLAGEGIPFKPPSTPSMPSTPLPRYVELRDDIQWER